MVATPSLDGSRRCLILLVVVLLVVSGTCPAAKRPVPLQRDFANTTTTVEELLAPGGLDGWRHVYSTGSESEEAQLLSDLQAPGGLDGWRHVYSTGPEEAQLLRDLQAPGGLDGWRLVYSTGPQAPCTPPALLVQVEAVLKRQRAPIGPQAPCTPPALLVQFGAVLQRQRAPIWRQLCEEIHTYHARRQARYDKAIVEWQALCISSDSDLD